MAKRLPLVLGSLLMLALCVACLVQLQAGSTKSTPKTIAPFALRDAAGRAVSLDDFKDKKAVVVVFLGTECPLNNLYLRPLAELHKDFADKGVQFLAINSNVQDTPQRIAAHAKKHEIPFPVLRDEGNKVADLFEARRTPEAFVLDDKRTIRYQGRIDDQYGIDYQRPAPTRRDLAEAVTDVLAGQAVRVATTPVAGCLIGRAPKTRADGDITFSKHVVPILQSKCQECHRAGQIGPMALKTYDDVTSWADMIREVVSEKRMPPWYADPAHGKFSNDRSLSAADRETLLAWLDKGMPRGKDSDLPPPREFPDKWKIGEPDVVIHMPNTFDVPAQMPKGGVPYKHYVLETNFDEDKWIERAEAKAGAPEVVHHILVFIVPPDKRFIPGSPDTPVLCGMAPGDMPMILKPGLAKFIPKGARLIFQMHYTPNGKAQTDRSYIGLKFAKKPPEKVIVCQPVFNAFFRIPKGDANYEVVATHRMAKDGYVASFMPHMHLRGKDFLIRAEHPDGKQETLLSVPKFNFGWQSVYRPVQPVVMPKDSKLVCVAHFDNSKGNRSNPNPAVDVFWGDQTWQEMMIGWVDFAYDRKE
jgi:peroxiredoxin